jgi:hypothetical protein
VEAELHAFRMFGLAGDSGTGKIEYKSMTERGRKSHETKKIN